ncbi:MAG: sugar ABC transporter permease [Chloroflexi bacterium]|nr:sugar ABC transporter permease [Chloroflexota bacterium]MBV9893890.1 sugar ABC transporter permease [Chloroflexota bacterium]
MRRSKSKPSSPSARPNSRVLREIIRHRTDYLWVAPALLVMLLVIGYPFVYTIDLSFYDTPPSSPNWYFDGVDNYTQILRDPSFWAITLNTFYWSVGSTILAFLIGLGAALVVQREFIGRGIIRGLLMIPYVISYVAAAYVWRWLYHSDYGLISGMLYDRYLIDAPINFLDSTTNVMPSLIVANVWKEFPFAMIMMLAGLQTVSQQLLNAARVDGANAWNRFWHVTVPSLRGVIIITSILLFVGNLNSFGLVWIMTGGGPANASQIWITEVYTLAFQALQYGRASAYSVILFIVMLLLGYFYVRALTSGSRNREARE